MVRLGIFSPHFPSRSSYHAHHLHLDIVPPLPPTLATYCSLWATLWSGPEQRLPLGARLQFPEIGQVLDHSVRRRPSPLTGQFASSLRQLVQGAASCLDRSTDHDHHHHYHHLGRLARCPAGSGRRRGITGAAGIIMTTRGGPDGTPDRSWSFGGEWPR